MAWASLPSHDSLASVPVLWVEWRRYGLAPVIPSEWAALRVVGTEGACIVQEHWRPRLTDEGVDVAGAAAAPPPPGASAGGAAGAHVEGATDSPGTDAAEGASVEQAIDGCDGKLPSLYHRTVVCDRTMLSHPTWRRYASQLEPLRSAQAALPSGQQLSGRAVRRTVCQVTDAALVVPPGGVVFGDTGGEEGGRQLKNIDLTGWFQFSTTCYSPHRDAIRSYFAPATVHEMMKGVRDAVAALSAGSALVGVHVRRGDYADRGKLAASEWADTGPFFTAPLSLYAGCLGQLAEAAAPQSIAVFVASNDPAGVTRDPEMSGYTVLTSADVRAHMSDDAWNSAMESLGPELASFYVDWYCLSICDALLISNSTFSFTAAMVAARNDAAGVPGGMAAKGRFWRPTPVEEAPGGSAEVLPVALEMRSFDPWAAFPLLNASRGRKRKAAAIN